MADIYRFFDHLDWANRRLLHLLRTEPELDSGSRRLFSHLLQAERIWIERMHGKDTSDLEIWPSLTLAEQEQLVASNNAAYTELLAGLSEARLREVVVYQNSQGLEFQTPIGDILAHVALHGAYHRGQIATVLRTASGEPVNTDYITFVREMS